MPEQTCALSAETYFALSSHKMCCNSMFAPKYEQKEILKFTLDSSLDDDKWTVLALKEFGRGMAKSCEPT